MKAPIIMTPSPSSALPPHQPQHPNQASRRSWLARTHAYILRRPALLLFWTLLALVVVLAAPLSWSSSSAAEPITQAAAATTTKGLIYDIGVNDGADTAFYLSQGYRVVGVDANPLLIGQAAGHFADSVIDGRLTLLNVGVVSDEALLADSSSMNNNNATTTNKNNTNRVFGAPLPFYIHKFMDDWSSMIEKWGCRSVTNATAPPSPENCHKILVPTTSCGQIVATLGRAVFMKIDVEGHDEICFLSVAKTVPHLLPQFVSVEGLSVTKVDMFEARGYTKFKFVPQLAAGRVDHDHTKTSATGIGSRRNAHGSGPWGDDAVDVETGRAWRTAAEARERLRNKEAPFAAAGGEWHDIVAAM